MDNSVKSDIREKELRKGAGREETVSVATVEKFYPLAPSFPKWDADLAYTSSDYLLINHTSNSTAKEKDPLLDNKIAIPFISAMKLKEIQYIVEKAPGEVAWMFLGKQLQNNSRHFLLYDFFLARQDASAAHVSLDMEDVYRYTKYLVETYPDQWPDGNIARDLHHGHSHVNMAVHFSTTDHNQQEKVEELGFHNDYRFFLVFNKRKEVRACLVNYFPVFYRMDNLPVGIYTGDGVPQGEITRERKKELDEQMQSLVKQPAPRIYHGPFSHISMGMDLDMGIHRDRNRDTNRDRNRGMGNGMEDFLDFSGLNEYHYARDGHTKRPPRRVPEAIKSTDDPTVKASSAYKEIMEMLEWEQQRLIMDLEQEITEGELRTIEMAAERAARKYVIYITSPGVPTEETNGLDNLIEKGLFSCWPDEDRNKEAVSSFMTDMALLYYYIQFSVTGEDYDQDMSGAFKKAMPGALHELSCWVNAVWPLLDTHYWDNLYNILQLGEGQASILSTMLAGSYEDQVVATLFNLN